MIHERCLDIRHPRFAGWKRMVSLLASRVALLTGVAVGGTTSTAADATMV